ncbi:TMEM175 family protein [Paenibacillus borealis]|uniref:DUF1211 domain-containing membrane protein n=1 Tax=Paenibacillus borealis TaxID=160799 RepID=A0A089L5U1_PAEBO|nr:TMEM175 family protein [Paenibacillus borealis]AIQ56162.1 hypothetical protein PBOR_03700 [Paenibacillus borealis]
MKANRMEAFSDGVLAIIITIMVLEFKTPEGNEGHVLLPLVPKIISYMLSFIYIGIYWNNHHHLLHLIKYMNGKIMWLNLLLLFWVSLIPFTTAWMGENQFDPTPTAIYFIIHLLAATSYLLLQHAILGQHHKEFPLAKIIDNGFKNKITPILYFLAAVFAYINIALSFLFYVIVTAIWFIPDKRIESALEIK